MGFKLSAGLGLALLILAGAFKMYYDKTQAEIEAFHLQLERSIQNQKTLESTIQQQNENLKQTIENQELMVAQIERLNDENKQAQIEVENIRKKFSRHNLNVLSLKKPGLIQKLVNKGTKEVLNDFRLITDSEQFDEIIVNSSPSAG
jgi:septal ring factor EnvC (AmiA/AmiB activator)